MSKALLTVLSGALIGLMLSSAHAYDQTDMEDFVHRDTGLTKIAAHNALDAFEKQLAAEMAQKHAVKLSDFGRYNPKELAGPVAGRDPRNGSPLTYQSWKLVKKPLVVDEATFNARAAERAGMPIDEYETAMKSFKEGVPIVISATAGNTLSMRGEGQYQLFATKEHVTKKGLVPSASKFRYKAFGSNHHTFTADKHLKCELFGC